MVRDFHCAVYNCPGIERDLHGGRKHFGYAVRMGNIIKAGGVKICLLTVKKPGFTNETARPSFSRFFATLGGYKKPIGVAPMADFWSLTASFVIHFS
jgi:hypothetical protein